MCGTIKSPWRQVAIQVNFLRGLVAVVLPDDQRLRRKPSSQGRIALKTCRVGNTQFGAIQAAILSHKAGINIVVNEIIFILPGDHKSPCFLIREREPGGHRVQPVLRTLGSYRNHRAQKLEQAAIDLFRDTWPSIRSGNAPRIRQDPNSGTHHRVRDIDGIDRIDLDATYTARELINILKARTFPPYPGAYFVQEDRKIFMRLRLFYENEL